MPYGPLSALAYDRARKEYVAIIVLWVLSFGALGGSLMGTGRAAAAAHLTDDQAVAQTWRHTEGDVTDGMPLRRELVRYATLAPSSHNTQYWKFRLSAPASQSSTGPPVRSTNTTSPRSSGCGPTTR